MKILRTLALVALPLAILGCSGGSDSIEDVVVQGVWRVDRFYTEFPNGTITDATSLFNGYRYTFFADGYVISQGRTGRVRGTWGAAGIDGRPAFGIAIAGTPMFFGRKFTWWIEGFEDTMVSLLVEDPHVSATHLVLVRI